jgi:DHA1 family bicyclomycin/chloramphenicol resistance-like MFS transporter
MDSKRPDIARPPETRTEPPPLWLLVLITFSGTLAMHMFVPALPDATRDLGTTTAVMQMTISLYILGLAGGQLVYGPISDAYGRRPALIAGLMLYTAGGAAALLAPGAEVLVGARLVQALGGCAVLVLGRAIVRDTAPPEDSVRRLAMMNLIVTIGPGLAPFIGGTLSASFGWRSIFVALCGLGVANLFFAWRRLPETGRPAGTVSVSALARDYTSLLLSPRFLGYSVGGGCATTSMYAFVAAAPFIFIDELHQPPHAVGLYLGILIMGSSIGNALTTRLVRRMPIGTLMVGSNLVSVASTIAFLAAVLLGRLSVPVAIATMFLFTVGAGMASPAALTKAIGVKPNMIGSAAGLYGFAQMIIGALCTSLAGLGRDPALAAGTVLAAAGAVGQVAFWVALRREASGRG